MIDEITEQLVDTVFSNKKIKEKVYPTIYGIVAFNLLMFIMVLYIVIKLYFIPLTPAQ